MNADTLLENFEILAEAPGGIDRLRELLLHLGVSGKLLPQISAEVREEILWSVDSLRLDEHRLWGENYLENSPTTWPKVPLARLGSWGSGGTPTRGNKTYYDGEIPWLVIGDLNDGVVTRAANSITKKGLEESSAVIVPVGAVFVAMYGSIGKSGIAGIECATNQAIAHCVPDCKVISTEYLFLIIRAVKPRLFSQGRGLAQQNISQTVLKHLMISVPPLAEQNRIVSKIDEVMALCDQLEQQQKQRDNLRTATRRSAIDAISTATTPEELETAWKRINNNWEVIADTPESVGLMRELILDLALHGKIVPQISSSNSVASLIQVMAQQKRRDEIAMGRHGKGSEFTRKKTLFNFPISWHKGFLGDIALIVMGNSPPGDSYRDNEEGVPLINGPVEFSKPQLGPTIRAKFTVAPTYMCKRGDLLVCVRGATTGRTNVSAFDACIGRGVALVRGWQSQKFINLFMWNIGADLLSKGKGTTFPSISFDDLAGLEIGLPPIEEQELIIKRVDELMALCDQLEAELKARSEVAEKFARSVVRTV